MDEKEYNKLIDECDNHKEAKLINHQLCDAVKHLHDLGVTLKADLTATNKRVAELERFLAAEKESNLQNVIGAEEQVRDLQSRIEAAVEKIQWWHQAFGCPDSSVDILRAVEDILTPDAEPSGEKGKE